MVELLQPIELLHPLLQRESAQRRYFYRLVEPIVRLAGTKVEIPVAFLQPHIMPETLQFVVNCFQCDSLGFHLHARPISIFKLARASAYAEAPWACSLTAFSIPGIALAKSSAFITGRISPSRCSRGKTVRLCRG